MLRTFLLLLFLLTGLYSQESKPKQLLAPEATLGVLDSIKSEAIVLGHGKKEVHAFIDPLCSLSQRYLQFLYAEQDRMFAKYTLYLYLYELPRKHSAGHIRTILASKMPDIALKSLMVNGDDLMLETVESPQIEARIRHISEAAEKIGVYKRPYIIINGKAK